MSGTPDLHETHRMLDEVVRAVAALTKTAEIASQQANEAILAIKLHVATCERLGQIQIHEQQRAEGQRGELRQLMEGIGASIVRVESALQGLIKRTDSIEDKHERLSRRVDRIEQDARDRKTKRRAIAWTWARVLAAITLLGGILAWIVEHYQFVALWNKRMP